MLWVFVVSFALASSAKPMVKRQASNVELAHEAENARAQQHATKREALQATLATIEAELRELVDEDNAAAADDADNREYNPPLRSVTAQRFANLVSNKAENFCTEVTAISDTWVRDAKKEAMEEITDDCRTGVGFVEGMSIGCGHNWDCAAGTCLVTERSEDGKVQCNCLAHAELEERLDAGTLPLADVQLKLFSGSRRDAVKYNVVSGINRFSSRICTSSHFKDQSLKLGLKFEEELCDAIDTLWLENHADRVAATVGNVTDASGWVMGKLGGLRSRLEGLATRVNERFDKVSRTVATALTNALKFIFAPAEAIPHVGEALHKMLMALTDYVGGEMEANLRAFFGKTVNEILQGIYQMAQETVENIVSGVAAGVESAVNNAPEIDGFGKLDQQLQFIFSCTSGIDDHFGALNEMKSALTNSIEQAFTPIYLSDRLGDRLG